MMFRRTYGSRHKLAVDNKPNSRETFDEAMMAVSVGLVSRTPTSCKLYLDARIEFFGYVNMAHTCVL